MTVETDTSRVTYAGDGVSTVFAIPFYFINNEDVAAVIKDTSGDGVPQTLNVDFTLTGAGDPAGGTLTMITAPASGEFLSITSDPPITQLSSFVPNQPFPSEAVENGFDRLTQIAQRTRDKVDRGLWAPDSDVNPDVNLPVASERANKYVTFDANGDIEMATSLPSGTLTSSSIATTLDSLKRTAAEISAGVTPTNYAYPPGWVLRYGTNTTPGTTDMAVALQVAIDSASQLYPNVRFSERAGISRPLLIRSSTTQGISILGESRAASVIEPKFVDISVPAQGVNCCIFNQNNNSHLHLEHMEWFATAAYTGIGIYCKEGGGADSSGQALFSAVLRDGFVVFPTTNSGFLTGAMQNSVVDTYVFEAMKGVFTFEGTGNSDNHYTNLSLYNCYDAFMLQTADTNGSIMLHIEGVNAYSHQRGMLFDVKNWNACSITNLVLEPATGNLGTVGIGKFTDCEYLELSHLTSRPRSGVPAGETILEFAGSGTTSAKVSDSYLTGFRALKVSATGSVALDLYNCDLSTAGSSCVDISGNCSGTIRTTGGRYNNAQVRCWVHSVANTASWYSYNEEFLNAGLGGNAGSRNIDLATSGECILYNARIGQNVGASAAAGYYIELASGTTLTLVHPDIVGTPPTGIKTGSGTLKIIFKPGYGGVLASTASLVLPYSGDIFQISGTTNITGIDATNMDGRTITLVFQDALTFTDGSNLKLAGNLVTTADDTISLVCVGSNWYETGRSVN